MQDDRTQEDFTKDQILHMLAEVNDDPGGFTATEQPGDGRFANCFLSCIFGQLSPSQEVDGTSVTFSTKFASRWSDCQCEMEGQK